MKNIKHYSKDTFLFHKSVVDSLNEGETKKNLVNNQETIASKYADYKSKFINNDLVNIVTHGFDGEDKNNLLKLYSSQRKPIIELKKELTTNEFNQRVNTCPNCTIDKVASLDHYIPKDEFPEFSVNPLNLIPCCSTCNSKKKENWKDDENLLFLNLYSDKIPKEQFLFVDIASKTDFSFKLKNIHNIDVELFKVIESHYSRLDLLQRFREDSDEVVSELDLQVSSFESLTANNDELIKVLKDHYTKIEVREGKNNWKVILINGMINSDIYF